MRKFSKTELLNDLSKINRKKTKSMNFGKSKQEKIVDDISDNITPAKKSRIKRILYVTLKATGMKLLDITDYTFKKIISMTIKYVGPIILTAVLIRYREPIVKQLLSPKDKNTYDQVAHTVGRGAERVGGAINSGKNFLRI
jgi:hypothetical protein